MHGIQLHINNHHTIYREREGVNESYRRREGGREKGRREGEREGERGQRKDSLVLSYYPLLILY